MQDLPHHYSVAASAAPEGDVDLACKGLETITSAPPAEYGGPGNLWSPETLLVSSIADCFVLTFRAIASASKLSWVSLKCDVIGTLDRSEGKTKFTEFTITATLAVAEGTNDEKAVRLLEKAETGCLITNSLSASTQLVTNIEIK